MRRPQVSRQCLRVYPIALFTGQYRVMFTALYCLVTKEAVLARRVVPARAHNNLTASLGNKMAVCWCPCSRELLATRNGGLRDPSASKVVFGVITQSCCEVAMHRCPWRPVVVLVLHKEEAGWLLAQTHRYSPILVAVVFFNCDSMPCDIKS